VLRAVKEDLESIPIARPEMIDSFIRSQHELLTKEIFDSNATYIWAESVFDLYFDLFVSADNSLSESSFKPKGIVSRVAANNYGNAWSRFISDHMNVLYGRAQSSKSLNTSSSLINSQGSNVSRNLSAPTSSTSQESIRVLIEMEGEGAIKLEKTWSNRDDARAGLAAFYSVLTTLVDPNERIDFVEISIESTNGVSLALRDVTQSKIEETLNKVLAT
jgi:hypothetical protein